MLSSTSNIRAFVHWSERTVFAGEEIECRITFKNIAPVNNASHSLSQTANSNGLLPGGDRQQKTTVGESSLAPTKNSTPQSMRTGGPTRGHRSTLSLNVLSGSGRLQRGGELAGKGSTGHYESGTDKRSHRRSVSIISLGFSDQGRDEVSSQPSVSDGFRRSSRGHARSSSLQIVPRRSVANGIGPLSGGRN
jgi:RAB6A-GEF complex partner protein 2